MNMNGVYGWLVQKIYIFSKNLEAVESYGIKQQQMNNMVMVREALEKIDHCDWNKEILVLQAVGSYGFQQQWMNNM